MAKAKPKSKPQPSKRFIYYFATILALTAAVLIAYWASQETRPMDEWLFKQSLMVGIAAQLVDGALGMAYGVTASTFLLWLGLPPALATSSIHISEIFTTAASGLSHWHKGHINKRLFLALLVPGIIGGLTGVYVVVNVSGAALKPWVAGYLFCMGLYILYRALKTRRFWSRALQRLRFRKHKHPRRIIPLALFGGFVDSVGGGGWGPVVSTTLLSTGHEPKMVIGTVNAAEFFMTVATGFSFAVLIGVAQWEIPAGLIVGGIITAPLGAHITSRLPTHVLMLVVGVLIASLSAFTIAKIIL